MQFVTIMFMVIIGAVIGWITNILAIKLLFRPLRPYKIPLLNYEIQGLLPKRKAEVPKKSSSIRRSSCSVKTRS